LRYTITINTCPCGPVV